MPITIGNFLKKRLKEINIKHLFGVAGDFNLDFLELLEKDEALQFIGNCNELNASYAADGYARINGIGAVITTYGVGDLSAINGIAGAYAEDVSLIHISGVPPLHAMQNHALLHHTLVDGNYKNVFKCLSEFTIDQAYITPQNAVEEIDRLFKICITSKKPVLLQIPSDIINHSVEYDNSSLKFYPEDTFSQQNKDFTEHLQALMNTAKKPVFILDKAIERWKLIPILEQFFKDTHIPFICMSTAKFLMNENMANCHGVFGSTRSLKLIKEADLIIGIGAKFSDITTQFFSIPTPKNNFINLFEDHTYINNQHFYNLSFKKVFEHIQIYPKAPISLHESINPEVSTSNVLQHKNFWPVIAKFIQNQDIVLGEMGTSNIALTTLNLDKKITYISQPLWGSIGYTLPALLGTLFAAPQKRQILFIGDGSLQLTVQELSTILRFNFKPIIFIINNKGYTIERAILGTHSSYNNIENWQYLNLPDVFNPQTTIKKYKVTHLSELKDCLIDIKKHDHLILVEVIFDPLDMPETLVGFGKLANLYDYGDRN